MVNSASSKIQSRRYIRFRSEPNQFAQLDFAPDRPEFVFQQVALIVDEAPMGGCCLLVVGPFSLKDGDVCRIKLGPLAPLRARLVWQRKMEEGATRLGFEFLE